MPLPVLQTPTAISGGDLLRYFHRTELDWSGHLAAERVDLAAGTALANPHLPQIVAANAVLEAAVPAGADPAAVVEEAEAWFAGLGCRCRRWVPNAGATPAGAPDPLAAAMVARGYARRETPVLRLAAATLPEPKPVAGITIIPARASYRHLIELVAADAEARGADAEQARAAAAAHLDDPAVDALLALRGDAAVGWVAVLPNGQVGRLAELLVAPAARRGGVGWLLAARAMEFCARATFKHVLAICEDENARRLLDRTGFVPVAQFVDYVRD